MATFLCNKNGCNEKVAKVHFDQIVNHGWNPHPSKEFSDWWRNHPHYQDEIDVVRARNCKCYVDEYRDAVSIGLAKLPTDYPI